MNVWDWLKRRNKQKQQFEQFLKDGQKQQLEQFLEIQGQTYYTRSPMMYRYTLRNKQGETYEVTLRGERGQTFDKFLKNIQEKIQEQEREPQQKQLLERQGQKRILGLDRKLGPRLIALLPEECGAEMGVIYRQLVKTDASPWTIRLHLMEELLCLLWGFYIQVKLDNLRLPQVDRSVDD